MACGNKPSRRFGTCFEFDQGSLEETGRLQFFYHSPVSDLPVRDVLNKHGQGHKTEPYLEKSAENYCVPCLQKNILGFLDSNEKYLFLFTRRSNPGNDRNRYIVGYLTKQRRLLQRRLDKKGKEQCHYAVQGPIKLVSFAEAFPLKSLTGLTESASVHLRFKKLHKAQTAELLGHFKNSSDSFLECLREVRHLKRQLNGGHHAGRTNTCRS